MRKKREKYYIGDRFKQIREMMKLNQTKMAGKLGITQQTYSRIESGRNQPPLEHIISVVKKFNVNPNYLLLGEGKLEKTPDKCPYLVSHQTEGAQEYACVIRDIINNKNIAEALGLLYGLKEDIQEDVLKILREQAIGQKHLKEKHKNQEGTMKLVCNADPVREGIEDINGDVNMGRFREHMEKCPDCRIFARCVLDDMRGTLENVMASFKKK